MELQIAKFGLLNDLAPDVVAPPGDTTLRLLDLDIKSWILATISDELKAMVKGKTFARDVWVALAAIFTGNRHARQMQLTTELLHQVQGTQPVASYCGCIKAIGDELAHVVLPQTDDALIVPLIRGLHACHKMTAKFIQWESTTISFNEAQNMLVHGETMERSSDRLATNTSLLSTHCPAPSVSHGGQGSYGPSGGSSSTVPNNGSSGGSGLPPSSPSPNQGKAKRKRFSNHGGYGWSPPTGVRPWTRVVQASPQQLAPPRPGGVPGILGSRPPLPQAYTMYAPLHPPAPYGAPMGFSPFQQGAHPPPPTHQLASPPPAFHQPTAPSFEQSALIGALQDIKNTLRANREADLRLHGRTEVTDDDGEENGGWCSSGRMDVAQGAKCRYSASMRHVWHGLEAFKLSSMTTKETTTSTSNSSDNEVSEQRVLADGTMRAMQRRSNTCSRGCKHEGIGEKMRKRSASAARAQHVRSWYDQVDAYRKTTRLARVWDKRQLTLDASARSGT
ncbi:hypothetical protein D1007_37059 [Hordeum vulgare]|nr:hypothetical protein D1007_37059 [Hordeum vulgare]